MHCAENGEAEKPLLNSMMIGFDLCLLVVDRAIEIAEEPEEDDDRVLVAILIKEKSRSLRCLRLQPYNVV